MSGTPRVITCKNCGDNYPSVLMHCYNCQRSNEGSIDNDVQDGPYPGAKTAGPAVSNEPKPTESGTKAVWETVIADMQERDASGLRKYGTRLRPFNGRDSMVDAYQEGLDLVVYMRAKLIELASVAQVLQQCANILENPTSQKDDILTVAAAIRTQTRIVSRVIGQ